MSSAEEPLAAPHQGPRPPAQSIEIGGRYGAFGGIADLSPGDALAEADDAPVLGVAAIRSGWA